ncbi:UPF0481 protein-like [Iris pallida]|uniref:UPF0481 protein-like n=1 Tax=Iris pallida TaxID=29817 RepID=A0AAX6I5M2_IRIPA|nr:UPF0481 protein-like [Iris pallida]
MATAEGGVPIDVEWLNSLTRRVEGARLRRHRRDEPRTIFRVPANMREGDPSAYQPRIISFGPFARDNPALKPMEKLKYRYVQKLLQRNPYAKLEDYVSSIRGLEVRSRACYSEDVPMGSNEFVEMMLLDGCFIVEILLLQTDEEEDRADAGEEVEEDPILTTNWTLPLVEYDMLMLENQIPFFIVEKVFELATSAGTYQTSCGSLNRLLLSFFDDLLPNEQMFLLPDAAAPEFYHVLHFVHYCIMPEEYKKSSQSEIKKAYKPFIYLKLRKIRRLSSDLYRRLLSSFRGSRSAGSVSDGSEQSSSPVVPESVPSATMLKESGVKFKEKDARSFLDVAFRDGTMEMPTLQVYDQTNSLFRNLIAFEQCLPDVGTHVATYAVLMDCLIDSGEDVALLHRYGCVVNGLGNDEDAAKLFNRLCKEVAVNYDACYLAGLFREVKKHCDSRWNKYRAKLMRDYFSNPWSFLSLVGALVIIALTVIQTSFAILAYFKPPHGAPT